MKTLWKHCLDFLCFSVLQKVARYVNRCAELLQQRKLSDAENALTVITEAQLICPYSEKLAEMKAEALFVVCDYLVSTYNTLLIFQIVGNAVTLQAFH